MAKSLVNQQTRNLLARSSVLLFAAQRACRASSACLPCSMRGQSAAAVYLRCHLYTVQFTQI